MTAALAAVAGMGTTTYYSATLTTRTITQRTSLGPATYTIANDGTVKNGAGATLETWTALSPALFEVRATLVDGTNPVFGAMGTWQSCATSRSWTNDGGGDQTSDMLVEIRLASSGTVQASAAIAIISRDPL